MDDEDFDPHEYDNYYDEDDELPNEDEEEPYYEPQSAFLDLGRL